MGAITGCGLFRKEPPAPTRSGAHSRFTPRECARLAFKLFIFNAPIKNWLNHRRKCAVINPLWNDSDYVVETKAQVWEKPRPRYLWRWGFLETTGGLVVGGFIIQFSRLLSMFCDVNRAGGALRLMGSRFPSVPVAPMWSTDGLNKSASIHACSRPRCPFYLSSPFSIS